MAPRALQSWSPRCWRHTASGEPGWGKGQRLKKAKPQLKKVEQVEHINMKGNTKNTKSSNKNVTFGIIEDSSILLYNSYQEHLFFFTTPGYM